MNNHAREQSFEPVDSETAMRIAEYERLRSLQRRQRPGKLDRRGDLDRGLIRLFSRLLRRWNLRPEADPARVHDGGAWPRP